MPDGQTHEGKPVVNVKVTPAELEAAQEKVELAFLRVQNLELNSKLIEVEHPKALEKLKAAQATLATLQQLAQG